MSKSTGISKNVQKDTENIEVENKKIEKGLEGLKEKENSNSSPNKKATTTKKEATSKKTTSSNKTVSTASATSNTKTKTTTKTSSAKNASAKKKAVLADEGGITEKIPLEKNAEKVTRASASKAPVSRKTATTAKTSASKQTATTERTSADKKTTATGKKATNVDKTTNSKNTANKTVENKAGKDSNNINQSKNQAKEKELTKQENTKNELAYKKKANQSKDNIKLKDESKDINEVDEKEIYENEEEQRETKYDTVTLEQIKEAIGSKVDNKQKKNIVKDILVNLGIAIVMVAGLIIVMLSGNNLKAETLEKSIKITTLAILAVGIIVLEASYKKDSSKMALNGVEILVYGGSFVCLIYTVKLYFQNLTNVISILTTGIAGYYVLKSMIVTILNTKKFKRENNDIKEIIKKKKVVIDE